jgi:hypothetical protein
MSASKKGALELRVVIPSKGRSETIRKHTLSLFPDATVLVDEAERDTYAQVVDEGRLITHPGVQPAVRILNWILDNVKADVVVIADDDLIDLRAMPGWSPRRYKGDPEAARQVLEATAQCAIDAGCGLFGFSQNEHPLFFRPQEPFRLNRWIGSVIGFVGDHGLRYDENVTLHEDADLSLQALMRHRIIWCENRWCFVPLRLTNAGGNTGARSADRDAEERIYLKEKWGRYIAFTTRPSWGKRQTATTLMTSLRVPRRQPNT